MASKKRRDFAESISDLKRCLDEYKPSEQARSTSLLALTKAFEISLEYGWKLLKREVEEKGLEANSPKDAVREAARVGIIDDPVLWLDAIDARNLSVHDYFSLGESDFVKLIRRFYIGAKSLK